jgi:hypothetical protein
LPPKTDSSLDVGLAAAAAGNDWLDCHLVIATIVTTRITIIVGTVTYMMIKPGTDGIAENVKKREMILPAAAQFNPSFANKLILCEACTQIRLI